MSGSVVNTRLSVIYRAIAAIVFLSIAGMAAFGMPNAAFARSSAASRSARSLFELINKERSEAGLTALILSEELSAVAKDHAVDMIERDYFGHVSPTSGTLAARLRSAGIEFDKAAENLAGCTSPKVAHKLLMESASHKANVLSERFTHVGVAAVDGGPYGMMIVEVFTSSPADVVGDDIPDVGGLESTPPSADSGEPVSVGDLSPLSH